MKKRAVKSGPTWIIKSEPRPEYVAPPRKSLKSADARKVVERLYTADCARREERVQANAKAYFRPATRRRRKGKKAVRSFLSRLRRSDAKRKKRLKAIRDAVLAAERGVERTAEDAVGLQNLSRLAAARPPPPTRPPPAPPASLRGPRVPPAAVVADVWRSARAPARRAVVDNLFPQGRGPPIRGTRRDAPARGPRGPHPWRPRARRFGIAWPPRSGPSRLRRRRPGNCGTGRNAWTSHPSCAELTSQGFVGTADRVDDVGARAQQRAVVGGGDTGGRRAARRPRASDAALATIGLALSGASSPFSFSFSPSSEPV